MKNIHTKNKGKVQNELSNPDCSFGWGSFWGSLSLLQTSGPRQLDSAVVWVHDTNLLLRWHPLRCSDDPWTLGTKRTHGNVLLFVLGVMKTLSLSQEFRL